MRNGTSRPSECVCVCVCWGGGGGREPRSKKGTKSTGGGRTEGEEQESQDGGSQEKL